MVGDVLTNLPAVKTKMSELDLSSYIVDLLFGKFLHHPSESILASTDPLLLLEHGLLGVDASFSAREVTGDFEGVIHTSHVGIDIVFT